MEKKINDLENSLRLLKEEFEKSKVNKEIIKIRIDRTHTFTERFYFNQEEAAKALFEWFTECKILLKKRYSLCDCNEEGCHYCWHLSDDEIFSFDPKFLGIDRCMKLIQNEETIYLENNITIKVEKSKCDRPLYSS